jgi:hypothetical protein
MTLRVKSIILSAARDFRFTPVSNHTAALVQQTLGPDLPIAA